MTARHTLVQARGRASAPPPTPAVESGIDRRQALAWLSSGAALAMAGCGKPREFILPYPETPPGVLAGVAERYATTLPLAGYGRGALVTSMDGRPTKVSGSPKHPASQGATDVFMEADVLGLYDPGRVKSPEGPDGPAAWSRFQAALLPRLALARSKGGAGLSLVTGRVTSPTELRLMDELRATMPRMAWRRFEPVDDDAARMGARLAFGRGLDVRADLARARVVLCLDADPLGAGPDQVANGRAYAAARAPDARDGMARWYAVEPGWSLTGMNADHRLPLTPAQVGAFAEHVAAAFGGPAPAASLADAAARMAAAVAADLRAHRGAALVLAGRTQPPAVHALAHWMNARLDAPVRAMAPVDPHPDDHGASLQALVDDLRAGRVDTLVAIGANPVYSAPQPDMEALWRRAPFTAVLQESADETGRASQWRLPRSHPLESWGDLRAPDGTASLVQPLIRPLYDSRTASELLAMLALDLQAKSYDQVRRTWRGAAAPEPPADAGGADQPPPGPAPAAAPSPPVDRAWRQALTDGVLPGAPVAEALPPAAAPQPLSHAAPAEAVLMLAPDPTVWDGRYAANAWLQEVPKPLSHEVWGASVAVSPVDAARWKLKDGEHARLATAAGHVEAAVRVVPGQAEGAVSGFLGGGRTAAGPVGTDVGFALHRIAGGLPFRPLAVTLTPLGAGPTPPRFTQTRRIEGEAAKLSPVVAAADLPHLHPLDPAPRPETLLPPPDSWEPSWAMVIDAAACIGCNACVVACQSENNVPVVGPVEVARGRDMHWLRIDAYDVGEHPAQPRPAFQPVPCMQCEHAPCEPVCPVEASIHDHEGLNGQVYNRCIGTRFCESNCPYQVRRFNFHGYSDGEEYADMGAPTYAGQKNPDVTVRGRGVMEKCTYCVQRISGARRAAEKENRPIGPGEVTTACQDSCPTRAIRFDDLTRPGSVTAAAREEPRHYALLGELGTRPRTTYLARLRNPNPALEGIA